MYAAAYAMKSPRLPAELTDMIIDHLRDSHPSLHAAARVCRAWAPRSRVHLFRRVVLAPGELPALVGFLYGAARVSGHIRHLVLQGRRDEEEDCEEVETRFLGALLALLPALRTLQLHDLSLRAAGQLKAERALEGLTLVNVATTPHALHTLLGSFTALAHLHLCSLALPTLDVPALYAPKVEALTVQDAPVEVCVALGGVRRVEVEVGEGEAEAAGALVGSVEGTVEVVVLDMARCGLASEDEFLESEYEEFAPDCRTTFAPLAAALARCTRLHTLELTLHSATWPALSTLLSRLPPSLRTLSLQLAGAGCAELDWSCVRAALGRGVKEVSVGSAPESGRRLSEAERKGIARALETRGVVVRVGV